MMMSYQEKRKKNFIQSNDEHATVFIFLTGSGGTGKSCVLEKVAALLRSEGCICKVSAARIS
jgi:adenylylsulfate kinase-like enzyme